MIVPTLSIEQQWAEKLHAYTRPCEGRANSRVKDLVDLLLLIREGSLSTSHLRKSVDVTFARRATPPVPGNLPPPSDWKSPFAALSAECGLPLGLLEAYAEVDRFWQTIAQA